MFLACLGGESCEEGDGESFDENYYYLLETSFTFKRKVTMRGTKILI